MMPNLVTGIHAVKENLKKGGAIVELFVAKERSIGRLKEILDLARAKGIPVRLKDKACLDDLSSGLPHQGIIGVLTTYRYADLGDLTRLCLDERDGGLLLVADHITDIGNLGSLMRTAEFFGVQGLILPKDRAASVTDAVQRISAGGAAYLPVARVANIARALREINKLGFWIVGAAGESTINIYEFHWRGNVVLVLGSEDKGLSRVVKKECHQLISIPRLGHLDSLNVAVAAGVILSEIARQRGYIKA
jgi:23S rRNA (guanosine2251-2'-O)-methyltransferase